jgi:uroporphyrinogen-III decarboxylase
METFAAKERIEAALRLEKPDRVPVVPMIDLFAGRYAGVTQHDLLFDINKSDCALQRTMDDLGRIDGQNLFYAGLGGILRLIFTTMKVPGEDGVPQDEIMQFVEKSIIEPGEYLKLKGQNVVLWLLDIWRKEYPQLRTLPGMMKLFAGIALDQIKLARSIKSWRRRGVEPLVGPNMASIPLEYMSISLRSMTDSITDLYRYPDEVKTAGRKIMKFFKFLATILPRLSGVRRVFMGGTRTSATFLSPKQFEEFALPQWLDLVSFVVKQGNTPILHLDSDWTPFFHYLKEFPRRKCGLNLDGTSDIFKAKEVLGDHMCIMGDVPATLLTLGEPEEVDEYCRRLIMELGKDGGFILTSGCTVPVDARPENVKAMLASVKRYKP